MGFKCGIVGLPNVGKSTLFNALTNSSKAQAENFPFCTIDPNIGIVSVPDKRLDELVKISLSKKKINTTISFVDIAGLVKGASKGEGLGNKFLSHIREVDAIIHMIRCFDSDDIQNYYLVVKYTNFTDEYLDPDAVVWTDKDNFIIPNNDPFLYGLSDIGHYSFKITSLDIAGNLEEKDDFDFIINYDSQSDSINLVNVPERWGYNYMTIDYVKANEYLDFDLYLSIG